MISFTRSGPAAVKSCGPILNMPALPRSESTNRRAACAVSTSSATINLFCTASILSNLTLLKLVSIVRGATSYCFVKRNEAFTQDNATQTFVNVSCDRGAFIDKARIDLDQAGPGSNHLPGIVRIKYSANAND